MRFLFGPKPYGQVDANTYHAELANTDHVIVDVRTSAEFMQGHAPGAMNIPLHDLKSRLKEIPADKTVVLICATGSRSGTAAGMLCKAGYESVYNLKGGTFGWQRQGYGIKR